MNRFFGVAALLLAVTSCQKRGPELTGPPVVFEIMQVDDEPPVSKTDDPIPSELSIQNENTNAGSAQYLRLSPIAGETLTAARAAVAPWIQSHLALPSGTRLAWGHEANQPDAVDRSFCVREPFINAADVADVDVVTDSSTSDARLNVTLRKNAADRFQEITRANVGRRLAIAFDGVVQMTPVVRSEITGGHLTITLDAAASKNASGLAAGLRGELLHAP